jgi:hypothetical protein
VLAQNRARCAGYISLGARNFIFISRIGWPGTRTSKTRHFSTLFSVAESQCIDLGSKTADDCLFAAARGETIASRLEDSEKTLRVVYLVEPLRVLIYCSQDTTWSVRARHTSWKTRAASQPALNSPTDRRPLKGWAGESGKQYRITEGVYTLSDSNGSILS